MTRPRGAPRLARWLLRRATPARHRAVVLDDLQEGFDARAAKSGLATARSWYRREARRCLGPALRVRAADLSPGRRLGDAVSGLRHAARRLVTAPAFTLTIVVTLGVALGVAATLFTLVDAVLLRPLPYPDAGRLAYVHHVMLQGDGLGEMPLSTRAAEVYRGAETIGRLGLWFPAAGNLTDGAEPERIDIAMVSPDLLDVLGVPMALGRGFTRGDALADPVTTIVLSHTLWARRYGADPTIVGRTIEFNGRDREVVGVLPASVRFPTRRIEAWMPAFAVPEGTGLGNFEVRGVARLAPGADFDRVAAELATISAELVREYPSFDRLQLRAALRPLRDHVVGDWEGFLGMLLVVGAVVLGVAAANVGGLLLVRAEHQAHELAVRTALGAGSRLRLRFHLAETVLLCGAASALALLIAGEGVPALLAAVPTDVPRLDEARLDLPIVLLTLLAGAVLAATLALLVAGRASFDRGASMLRRAGGAIEDARAALWRQAIIAGQLAVAVALVSIAALLVRSVAERQRVDLGFDADGVITAQIPLSYLSYREYPAAAGFWEELLGRVRALPGVEAAGAIDALPLADGASRIPLEIADAPRRAPDGDEPMYAIRLVTPGYFEALGVPAVGGRFPDDADLAVRPVMVSESLAAKLDLELGDRLRWSRPDAEWSTIVGVVGDVRDRAPDADPDAVLYVPVLAQQSFSVFVPRVMTLAIRMEREPASVIPGLRAAVGAIDSALPVTRVREMPEWVAESTAAATFATVTIASAAAMAALLGAVGLYGVVAYLVGRRRREIGIRIALGALPGRVAALAVSGSVRPGLVGCIVGLGLAAAGVRLVGRWLFAVSPLDPIAILATVAVLIAIVVVATWAPTRRALGVDPASVLRG